MVKSIEGFNYHIDLTTSRSLAGNPSRCDGGRPLPSKIARAMPNRMG